MCFQVLEASLLYNHCGTFTTRIMTRSVLGQFQMFSVRSGFKSQYTETWCTSLTCTSLTCTSLTHSLFLFLTSSRTSLTLNWTQGKLIIIVLCVKTKRKSETKLLTKLSLKKRDQNTQQVNNIAYFNKTIKNI